MIHLITGSISLDMEKTFSIRYFGPVASFKFSDNVRNSSSIENNNETNS